MFEHVVVVRFAHRRERDHLRQTPFEIIGVGVNGLQRGIARLDEIIALACVEVARKRHQAVGEETIN